MNYKNKGSSNVTVTIIAVVVLLVILAIGVIFFRSPQEEVIPEEEREEEVIPEEDEEEKEDTSFEEEMKEIVESFIGKPHKSGPLDEDTLYTEEGFDSTTLVLSSVAKFYAEDEPEEEMKKINYYPQGEVSYENRLHFSTYRNKVSDYFSDITERVGGDYAESKTVVLNKEGDDGRLIDIDWEEEIEIYYIPVEYVLEALPELPLVCGVMFIMDGDEEIGLDVRTEGVVVDGVDIIYASSSKEEVTKSDFIEYLDESEFDGVVFYEFVDLEDGR